MALVDRKWKPSQKSFKTNVRDSQTLELSENIFMVSVEIRKEIIYEMACFLYQCEISQDVEHKIFP